MKFKVLLVEDDENLGTVICDLLEMNGFQVIWEKDGERGYEAFKTQLPHLCVIDIMMPKMDGFTMMEKVRSLNSETPVMFLTARSMETDRVRGFELGADDYVTKPFSNKELILRIDAILKRCFGDTPESIPQFIDLGKYRFNPGESSLTVNDHVRSLTKRENAILTLLAVNQNTTVKRSRILVEIWGSDDYFSGRSLDVFIAKLRKYLNEDSSVTIENIHGVGFRLKS